MPGTLIMAENMAAMAVNPRSQASTATGQCLQRYLSATMHYIAHQYDAIIEPPHEKINNLLMRSQRSRSAFRSNCEADQSL